MAKFKRNDTVMHESGWFGVVKNTMLDGHMIQFKGDDKSYWDADVFVKVEVAEEVVHISDIVDAK